VFNDRGEAGRQLARRLAPYTALEPVVVGLPRGGVPVAAEVADRLGASPRRWSRRDPGGRRAGNGVHGDGENDAARTSSPKRLDRRACRVREDELFVAAKELGAPYELVKDVAANGRLPVVNFVAGGISTPADAALVMQLGAEGVFVGSGIFKSDEPARMANAIVQATTFFDDPKKIAEVSKGLGAPMRGIALEEIPDQERLAVRGW